MRFTLRGPVVAALLVSLGCISPSAGAHGNDHVKTDGPVAREQKAWGVAGDVGPSIRTIRVSMNDTMRFTPGSITVAEGETVRLVVKNDGKLMHEFVLGTKEAHDEHAALMLKFPNMDHDEPYMAHVAPGRTSEIVWTFNRAGEFGFACLIAGHYQSGMVGKLSVRRKVAAAP